MAENQEAKARLDLAFKCSDKFNRYGKLLLQGATGSGKTKIALELIDKVNEPWDILVPKRSIITEWHNEIDKWGYDHLQDRVNVYCYDSLHKNPRRCNLVLDEAHRLTPAKLPMAMNKNQRLRTIGLSATVPYDRFQVLRNLGLGNQNRVVYKLDQAVDDTVVVPYHVTVIYFRLDDQLKIIEVGPKHNKFMVTEEKAYEFRDKHFRQAIASKNHKQIEFAVRNRMNFIYNLPSKVRIARPILNMIPDSKKTLVFTGRIAQANQLCKHRYHSKTTVKDFERFKAGEIMRLSAVGSISEGVNIPELDVALITQVRSNQLHMIQQTGRLLRKTSDPNKVGRVIVLCCENTQDRKWVDSALGDFDESNIDRKLWSDVLKNGLPGFDLQQ
jgi:superfamily II DNA or RNA helicase